MEVLSAPASRTMGFHRQRLGFQAAYQVVEPAGS
jgi:hypothetical protein